MSEKILNVDYESEMGQSYVDYSMSVITERNCIPCTSRRPRWLKAGTETYSVLHE